MNQTINKNAFLKQHFECRYGRPIIKDIGNGGDVHERTTKYAHMYYTIKDQRDISEADRLVLCKIVGDKIKSPYGSYV